MIDMFPNQSRWESGDLLNLRLDAIAKKQKEKGKENKDQKSEVRDRPPTLAQRFQELSLKCGRLEERLKAALKENRKLKARVRDLESQFIED